MKFLEIEYKYRADDIKLEDFVAFCRKDPHTYIQASGYDYFYDKADAPGSFCRHRVGPDMNQLTFKRKTDDKNNYVRTEHNIDLKAPVSGEQVEALCAEFGYRFNVSIFKTCFVFKYERHTFVFYVCYDTGMHELGRFLEIEMAEDYDWGSEAAARAALLELEEKLEPFGITWQCRMRKSLFELFRKEKK